MPTVFSIIRKPDLTEWPAGRIMFRAAQAPLFRTPDTIVDEDIEVITDSSGYFAQQLAPGYYWVWIGSSRPFVIIVPETAETYLLLDLRKEGTGVPTGLASAGTNYRIQDGILELVNATTGLWHPIWLSDEGGSDRLAFGDPEGELPDENYRIDGATLLLKNVSTGVWKPPLISGSSPAFTFAVGSELELPSNFRTLSGALQWSNPSTGNWHTIFVLGETGAETLAIGDEVT